MSFVLRVPQHFTQCSYQGSRSTLHSVCTLVPAVLIPGTDCTATTGACGGFVKKGGGFVKKGGSFVNKRGGFVNKGSGFGRFGAHVEHGEESLVVLVAHTLRQYRTLHSKCVGW
eukprot:1317665-Rhodomonas_salina.1